MAKFDDFGRPIYETAEEYNRAKKTGGYSRAYTKPEEATEQQKTIKGIYQNKSATERHAMRSGSQKAKKLILGLIAVVVAINVSIALIVFNSVGVFTEVEVGQFDDVDCDEEYLGDDTTPLPEGFETFVYNGETISLPTTFEDLSNMKFVIDTEYQTTDTVSSGYSEMINLIDAEENDYAMISVDNYTEEEIPLGKCEVDYFCISNPAVFDDTAEVPEFMFVNGLTFESTYEDLEATFGIPYHHYEDHSEEGYYYDSYEWQYCGAYETHYVTVAFWNDVISDISIQKNVDEWDAN